MGQVFGNNSTFYIQFAYRISPEVVTNMPVWQVSPKVAIFYYGQSCAALEQTTGLGTANLGSNGSFGPALTMYGECGGIGDVTLLDGATWTPLAPPYLYQQGDYSCQYSYGPPSACWRFPSDKWVTLYYKIHIGTFGQPNSTIEVWYSVDGQPYVKWLNVLNNFTFNKENAYPGFAQIQFTPYMTNLSIPTPQTSYIWYDELIVSTQPISAPGASTSTSSGTPPAPPSSLVIR
jgi:hypothetical protein